MNLNRSASAKINNPPEPGKSKRSRLIMAWGIFVLVVLFLLGISSFGKKAEGKSQVYAVQQATPKPAVSPVKLTADPTNSALPLFDQIIGKLSPLAGPPASAQQVVIGMYIKSVYDLDTSSNTYYLSGYIWLRWHGNFNPVATLEFSNAVDEWAFTKTLDSESPIVLPDGSNYQILHIEGRFFQPFDLHNYPLDRQELALYVENNSETLDKVVYLPDNSSTGYDETLVIPGWNINGLTGNMFAHDYGTDFGQTGVADASKYSSLKFSLQLDRVNNLFIWRLLLPLLIVLLTNWLSLLLKPTLIEVRTALPATALLTMVFMQRASLDAIPQVPTLVLMDKIYGISYVLIVVTFIQIIWANNHVIGNDTENVARIQKIDLWSFVGQILVFALVLVLLVLGIH